MALAADLTKEVEAIFKSRWEEREGREVPDPTKLKLGNDGVKLKATILYADMAESTKLVDDNTPQFAAEVYKAFLTCSAKLIRESGGTITAYDGDRIMGVYIGDYKNTSAVKTALKINYAVKQIITPAMKAQYPKATYVPGHSVGIDTSDILVARIGVRNDNDLVWVGRAANYAAKLCSLREGNYVSWMTGTVYDTIHDSAKLSNGQNMWEEGFWTKQDNLRVYRSTWQWKLD